MVRILEFENKIEARYFCKFHGLNVTEEIVILDKTSYVDPEDSWPPRRSQKLIESKLDKSVGEVSNNAFEKKLVPTTTWKIECVLSFNMDWWIKFTDIRQPMLKLKTHSGFHELFRF